MSSVSVQRQPSGRGPLPGDGPLWARIRADLERRLQEGEFGAEFPGELALAAHYAASRHTIRQALGGLRRDGLVTAARGRTSRVAASTLIEQPTGALYSLFASVEAAGMAQRSVVRCLDLRSNDVVADRLGLAPESSLLYLERLRLADGEPLAVDRVWLPAAWADPLLAVDFTHTSLYEQLSRRCEVRLTGGQERIRAVVPTAVEQRLLGCPPGVAALALDRLGCADGVPAEWRKTLIRGDRFSLTAQFSQRSYRFDPAGSGAAPFPVAQRGDAG